MPYNFLGNGAFYNTKIKCDDLEALQVSAGTVVYNNVDTLNLKVDNINELTTDNGVNIENVNIKDDFINVTDIDVVNVAKIDTITEKTLGNGVNIENVNIKDSEVNADIYSFKNTDAIFRLDPSIPSQLEIKTGADGNGRTLLVWRPSTSGTAAVQRWASNFGGSKVEIAKITGDGVITSTNIITDNSNLNDLQTDFNNLQDEVDDFPDALKNLTTQEINQIRKINNVTINNTQWSYLGNLDQNINTASSPSFINVSSSDTDLNSLKSDVDGFPDSLKNLTTDEITQIENIDSVSISNVQWGYLGGLDQNINSSSDVQFNSLEIDDFPYLQEFKIKGLPSQENDDSRYLLLTLNTDSNNGADPVIGEFFGKRQDASGDGRNYARIKVAISTYTGGNPEIFYEVDKFGADVRLVYVTYNTNQYIAIDAVETNLQRPLQFAYFYGSDGDNVFQWVTAADITSPTEISSNVTKEISGILNTQSLTFNNSDSILKISDIDSAFLEFTMPETGDGRTLSIYRTVNSSGFSLLNGYSDIGGTRTNKFSFDVEGLLTCSNVITDDIDVSIFNGLTSGEIDQIKNIDSVVLDNTQWQRLANINQPLETTSNVQFNSLQIGNIVAQNNTGDLLYDLNLNKIEFNSDISAGDSSTIFNIRRGIGNDRLKLTADGKLSIGGDSELTVNEIFGTGSLHTNLNDYPIATFYSGSTETETVLPIGSVVTAYGVVGLSPNLLVDVYYDANLSGFGYPGYGLGGGDAILSGNWRLRGTSSREDGSSGIHYLVQRVA